jgi:hypothetical protein
MNTPTPTPRTDAAWSKTFEDDEDQSRAGNAATDMRDECAKIECELTRLRAESDRADIIYHRACEVEHELRAELRAERDQLRSEVERFKGWLADPHALHAHCLRTLNEGQIAHLFGERMTEVANRAEKAEAALASPPLLTGKLTHAGTCYIGEEHVDGVFIAIDREQLKALSRLPMYEQIELRAIKGTPSTP